MSAKQKKVEERNVTASDIASALHMSAKSLRRKLRAETRDTENDIMHKQINRKTRYAFTQDEANAIIERFSATS